MQKAVTVIKRPQELNAISDIEQEKLILCST